jgi:hypothetical protein
MAASEELVSKGEKRKLIAQDLRSDPYLTGENPTTLYLKRSLPFRTFTEVQEKTSSDELYGNGVSDETVEWVIQTFLKYLPWRTCFYKKEPDKRG